MFMIKPGANALMSLLPEEMGNTERREMLTSFLVDRFFCMDSRVRYKRGRSEFVMGGPHSRFLISVDFELGGLLRPAGRKWADQPTMEVSNRLGSLGSF
jgi:hypothetical protein